MSNVKIITDRSDIVAIADAVRRKTGDTNEMTIGQMINSINNLPDPSLIESYAVNIASILGGVENGLVD